VAGGSVSLRKSPCVRPAARPVPPGTARQLCALRAAPEPAGDPVRPRRQSWRASKRRTPPLPLRCHSMGRCGGIQRFS